MIGKLKNKRIWLIPTALLLIIVICLSVIIIKEEREKNQNAEKYKEMVEITPPPQEETQEVFVPAMDFTELQAQNSDIYAWIDIPDTVVSYPMLRSEQEDFYLDHNADKQKSVYGAIYTQSYNSDDFEDFNTIIYGHDMKNGTMFGSLKKYRNREYFDEHQYINVYTPEKNLTYRIFAAYVYDDRHILYSFDFENESTRRVYILDILSGKFGGNINSEVAVTAEDKIITLSTCTGVKTQRYLVQAVLVE